VLTVGAQKHRSSYLSDLVQSKEVSLEHFYVAANQSIVQYLTAHQAVCYLKVMYVSMHA
jgi:hypothetical protein